MNFPGRLGVGLIAGLLSCGLIPAAYAAAAPATFPKKVATTATTLTVTPRPDPETSSLEMPCQLSVKNTQLTVAFPSDIPVDELTATVNDSFAAPQDIQAGSVVLQRPDSGSTVKVELSEEKSLTGECTETVPPITPEPTPPEPTPSETDEPATPDPSHPEPTKPPQSATPAPTKTSPGLTPTPPTSSKPTATGSSSSSSSRPTSDPPASTAPSFLPSETTERTAQREDSITQQQPAEPMGPRIIRQFSHDPRHLLPQLLGIDVQPGSGLIMPRPRSADQGPPDLETLPPVSEDELEAIKARLSSPDRADRPPGDHLATADERIADRTSSALLPGLLAAVCLGTAIFWLRKRRQRDV
mgnify:CR=1 FL=1